MGVTAASLGQEADKAGNMAVLADQLNGAAKALAQPMISRLSKIETSSKPSMSLVDDFDAKRREAYKPLENYCRALESELKPFQNQIRYDKSLGDHWTKRDDGKALTTALATARLGTRGILPVGGMRGADFDAIDSSTKLVYEGRLATYDARIVALQQRSNNCNEHQLALAQAKCVGAFNLTETGFRDNEEYARAFEAERDRRQQQLQHIRALLKEIERASKQARLAADEARACVQQAEADGKIPNAQTVAEAAGLADLSAVSCDVAEFDRRIGELSAAKFKDVDGVAQHLASLKNKRNIIQAAHAKFNEGRTHFIDGDPAAAIGPVAGGEN